MDTALEGCGILVTGGAGGIGRAVVRAFADEGSKLAVHYFTSEAAGESLAAEVGGVALRADLRQEDEANALISQALEAFGRLDVCVVNAGTWPKEDKTVWELPVDRWRATLESNLTASFLTLRAFLAHVARSGKGNAVLVGSTAGIFGEAGHADYAASKGGIMTGLLLSAKNEAARISPQVRVNVVAPGWTATPMSADALEDPVHVARATSTMALKKVASPEDIARQIVVLASDRLSGHVTGQVVTVAGGMEGRLIETE